MTAIKPMTATDNSLAKLRAGGEPVSSRLGQLTRIKPMEALRQNGGWRGLLDRGWHGFQETRSKPVGDLIPDRFRQSVQSASDKFRSTSTDDDQFHDAVVYEVVPANSEHDYSKGTTPGSMLPMAIIVAGLGGLSILAVLKNGPTDTETMSTAAISEKAPVAKVAVAEQAAKSPVAIPAIPAVPGSTNSGKKEPVQLAATIAPVVFETGADPSSKKPEPKRAESAGKTAARVAASPANAVAKGAQPAPEVPEMLMLQGENERLKEMMAALEYETLSLNSELLKLELSLSQAQAEQNNSDEPEQVVETLTVYNFVNVPVGGAVEDRSGSQSAPRNNDSYNNNLPVATYVDNTISSNQNQYLPQAPTPTFIADLPAPEMGYMPPNDQLYAKDVNYSGTRPDPYLNQNGRIPPPGYMEQTEQQLYGSGADVQYGPADQSMDARRYPPVN